MSNAQNPSARRITIGPFNRVEGDLEVRLSVRGDRVDSAEVSAPLYRGFEQIMQGRVPLDALTIIPRVCGICSVSQSLATTATLRSLAARDKGVSPDSLVAENGRLASHLVHAAENIADHLTHSFVFFLPDFAHGAYAKHPWHPFAQRAYAANRGTHTAAMIRLRARLLHVVGLLAGKWPHSLALQPGGTTVAADSGTKARLLSVLADVRQALEQQVFAAPLERIAGLATIQELADYASEEAPESADFRFFLTLCHSLSLDEMGLCLAPHLSFGAYHAASGSAPLYQSGLWHPGERSAQAVPLDQIREDLTSAWYDGDPSGPDAPLPHPDPDRDGAYSWCKAPRLSGHPAQTGAFSRQVIDRHPLALALALEQGSTVATRVIARFIEVARLIPAMEGWVRALSPREPFCLDWSLPQDGQGVGLVEAARGALGHWITLRHGRIQTYQIIAPTTWNFSPRDASGTPGPVEQALANSPAPEHAEHPRATHHIVRSFDPCMVCTVH